MAFKIPIFEQIRDDILRDLQSLNPQADTAPDSDYFVRASSIASCASGLYAHQSWIARQIFPDTADSDFLELHAGLHYIFRKPATPSAAVVTFAGAADTVIPLGTEVKPQNSDTTFKTITAATIGAGGAVDVVASASRSGSHTNIPTQTGQLLTAIADVQSAVTFAAAVGGGDEETDASLLSRLLSKLRLPPAGGNANDYKQWALSVPGVAQAYVFPLRRGLGTVDVVITGQEGLPSDEVIAATQAFIDQVRPVTAKDVSVYAPATEVVDISVKVATDEDLNIVSQRINEGLHAYFADLAPNQEVIKSQIEGVITDTRGVDDRQLINPSANLQPPGGGVVWYKLGSLTVEAL